MSDITIDIKQKAYQMAEGGSHVAIEGLALSIEPDTFVAISGPSGCGKTTLLNMISGLDQDFSGSIQLPAETHNALVYLFQTPRLLPWRSVLQNLTLALNGNREAEDHARKLLQEVGLKGFEDSFPNELSIGMQKRVALARAFALEPSLLLMDEPFSSLDKETALKIQSLLQDLLGRRSVTTLLITHDLDEAVMLSDRLILLAPAPTRIIADIEIPLTKSERADPDVIRTFCKDRLSF